MTSPDRTPMRRRPNSDVGGGRTWGGRLIFAARRSWPRHAVASSDVCKPLRPAVTLASLTTVMAVCTSGYSYELDRYAQINECLATPRTAVGGGAPRQIGAEFITRERLRPSSQLGFEGFITPLSLGTSVLCWCPSTRATTLLLTLCCNLT